MLFSFISFSFNVKDWKMEIDGKDGSSERIYICVCLRVCVCFVYIDVVEVWCRLNKMIVAYIFPVALVLLAKRTN